MKIYRNFLYTGDVIQLKTHQNYRCSFLLMDDYNLRRLRSGNRYHYYGGETRTNPSTIKVPNTGHWNIVLDFDRMLTYHLSVNPSRFPRHSSL